MSRKEQTMEETALKELLKQRFNELLPNCTLYAIDFWSDFVNVFYKTDSGIRIVARVDDNTDDRAQEVVDKNLHTYNDIKVKQLFEGIETRLCPDLNFKSMEFWRAPF